MRLYKRSSSISQSKMNNVFLRLNKIVSHIITWGNPLNKSTNEVILCISGNPGLTDFYSEFGAELFKNTNIPVCVVGHAGHEEVSDKQSNQLKGQESLFSLDGQINHKLDLIMNHIPKDCKMHLIGHSIGSWLILELLEKHKGLIDRITTVNLLFPTVQKMAKSTNGLFLNNVIRRIHFFLMLLVNLINFIPNKILNIMLGLYMKWNSLPEHYFERVSKFFKPYVIEKVLFMAYDEMDNVQSLNCEILEMIKGITNVLYSPRDGWAPVHYMDDFKKFEPDLRLKQVDADHAFVLKSSIEIAEMVSDFIKSKSQ